MSLSWIKPQWHMASNVTTNTGPAICAFSGKLHMVWKSADNNNILHSYFDGCSWTSAAVIPGAQTTTVPSLATASFPGMPTRLYMAWRNAANQLQSYSWYNGSIWNAPQPIPGTASTHGPSLAFFSGKLWAAWKGGNVDLTLWHSTFDGANWTPQLQFPLSMTSSASPSLCVSGARLYMFWRWSAASLMSRTYTTDGITWSAATSLPGSLQARTGPSAAATASYTYVFWDEASSLLHYTATTDGNRWGFGDASNPEESLPGSFTTSARPAVAVWNSIVWVAWKGNNGDTRIWWTRANY